MGGWCGATAADAIAMKTRMRLRSPIGGGVCLAEHNGKKCQKLCTGEVLPLDRSLLMGGASPQEIGPGRYSPTGKYDPHSAARGSGTVACLAGSGHGGLCPCLDSGDSAGLGCS